MKQDEYYFAAEAISLLVKAKEFIEKIEDIQGGCDMSDTLCDLIDALEYVGTDEAQG